MRHWLRPLHGAAGETLDAAHPAAAVELLLQWAVGQQRPDRASLAATISRDAWLDRTSWRPVLALACQYGFMAVPAFRDRYRGHAEEAAASQLCGLWSVGASTYYRYLDKAKRALATLQEWLVPESGFFNGLLGWGIALLSLWIPLYLLLMQKRVYGQGWLMTLFKFWLLGTIYFFMLGVVIVAALFIGLLTL